MILLVSDTSVLIDLERGDLLPLAFATGIPMLVPDLLYANELEPYNGNYYRSLGLQVVSLQPDEVSFAQRVKNERKPLSLPDCFALSCARRQDHVLLTGDGALRAAAKDFGDVADDRQTQPCPRLAAVEPDAAIEDAGAVGG